MATPFENFDLLTLADAAELLRCSKAHVCKAVSGRIHGCSPIPCVSLGRRKLIRRESLRQWIERNERACAECCADATISTLPERDAGKRA
ncbi:MAG: helix-turn-helix domain-containing protein [Terracidiphilus sp.]